MIRYLRYEPGQKCVRISQEILKHSLENPTAVRGLIRAHDCRNNSEGTAKTLFDWFRQGSGRKPTDANMKPKPLSHWTKW